MKRKIAQTFLIMMQQFKVQKEGRASRIESLSIAIALYLNFLIFVTFLKFSIII